MTEPKLRWVDLYGADPNYTSESDAEDADVAALRGELAAITARTREALGYLGDALLWCEDRDANVADCVSEAIAALKGGRVVTLPLAPDLAAHTEAARHDNGLRCHGGGYVRSEEESRGRCSWTWRWEDTTLMCWHYDMPPTGYCVRHAALLEVQP